MARIRMTPQSSLNHMPQFYKHRGPRTKCVAKYLVSTECGVQREEAVGGECLELLAVYVVDGLVPAAEEHVRLAHRLSLRLLPRPLLRLANHFSE